MCLPASTAQDNTNMELCQDTVSIQSFSHAKMCLPASTAQDNTNMELCQDTVSIQSFFSIQPLSARLHRYHALSSLK